MIFRKKKNARSEYRVTAKAQARVVFRTEAGPVEAMILDISAHGCGVKASADLTASIEVGDNLPLRIVLGEEDAAKPLFLRGSVRSIDRETRGETRLGLKFKEVERLFPQLREDQWRYFNRRAAFRVEPVDPGQEQLLLRFTGKQLKGTRSLPVLDVAEQGFGVLVDQSEPGFDPVSTVRARFELPGRKGTIDVGLVVAHRTDIPDGTARVGLLVDDDETRQAESTRESIGDWVVERQREIMART